MATLEDRLLGEKTHYYCSSSEDEEEPNEDSTKNPSAMAASPEMEEFDGSSTNTGPKGVIKDWQRFKQLETEQRREQEREKIALAKKLAMSCRSHLDDEKAKQEEENVDDLVDESILREYILKRMEEMMETTSHKKTFGRVLAITSGEKFLEAVDKEEGHVTVVVHLFEASAPGCEAMNGSLISLAEAYPQIKFCCLQASNAGLSKRFQGTGLPALLVYKSGQMVGNFVRLTDDLGQDFFATDVEAFLVEHGILTDKSLLPPGAKVIRSSADQDDDDDSD